MNWGEEKAGNCEGDQAIGNTFCLGFFLCAYLKYIHLVAEIEGSQIKMEEDSFYAFSKNTVH